MNELLSLFLSRQYIATTPALMVYVLTCMSVCAQVEAG